MHHGRRKNPDSVTLPGKAALYPWESDVSVIQNHVDFIVAIVD
jgi:hypothetical protein